MYSQIKEQFCEVIRHSQGIENPKVDKLFNMWKFAKKKFINRFGGLIYEWPHPVEFTLNEKDKIVRVDQFIDNVSNIYDNQPLADFIEDNKNTFFDNKISYYSNNEIPKGMKLIKAFKFFESNEGALRNLQDAASQIIQENKITGTLCFSVHPLDFLSSSENTYNWRSCHALDGEFRAGNLSYMLDETTFMVYLKGADNISLPAFGNVKWNSKKWRMLIHAKPNDEIIFAGRQYPFFSRAALDVVLGIYNNLYQTDSNLNGYESRQKYPKWNCDYINTYFNEENQEWLLNYKYIVIKDELYKLKDLVKQGHNALNYNDILYSSCYIKPYYAIITGRYIPSTEWIEHPLIIGEEVPCLICEDELIQDECAMTCVECGMQQENLDERFSHCQNCGCVIYNEESIEIDNGDIICSTCYENECFRCGDCGRAHYRDESHYCENIKDFICNACYKMRLEE